MFDKLKEFLSGYHFLGPTDILQLAAITRFKSINKGEHFIRAGEKSYDSIFVIKGLLRSYVINDHGEDITMLFVPRKKTPRQARPCFATNPPWKIS